MKYLATGGAGFIGSNIVEELLLCGETVIILALPHQCTENLVLPSTEDLLPKPLSHYAVTKLAGEKYGLVFTRLYGLEKIVQDLQSPGE